MNGWIEKNEKIKNKIENKLSLLPPIFTEFYIDMQGDGKSISTINSYIDCVSHFMKNVNNTQDNDFYVSIKPSIIKQYIISSSTRNVNGNIVKTSDDYQALRWSAINTFFNFLMVNEYIKENPMLKTKRPKINTEHEVVYLNEEEINQVMENINNNYTGNMLNRDKAIIGLALATGLRVSAIVQINLEDIDFENNVIKVIEKRMKTREIAFGDNAKKLLLNWIETRNLCYGDVDTSALFLSQWKRRITTNGVRDIVTKYTKDLSKHITVHKLRATAGTQAASSGISIQAIANMFGHESIQTSMRYVKVLDAEKNKTTKILDNLI